MQELLEILSAMAAQKEKVRDRRELLLDMADRVVKTVSHEFSCRADEVAILLLSADGRHLRFAAPRPFADLGSIPVTKRDSIAVGVLARRSGEVINNVPMVKHVSFFESIKLRDKPAPIQKMVTVPLVVRGAADRRRADQPEGRDRARGRAGLQPGGPAPRAGGARGGGAVPGRRAPARLLIAAAGQSGSLTNPLSSTMNARPIAPMGRASTR